MNNNPVPNPTLNNKAWRESMKDKRAKLLGEKVRQLHRDEPNVFTHHYDAGHGWLEVSAWMLLRLGLDDMITRFSYAHNGLVFLEEDIDAPLFLRELDRQKFPWEIKQVCDGTVSEIRSYCSYS